MGNRVADRLSQVEESATYAVFDLVRELHARGVAVLDLAGGDPDFPTADHITAEGVVALQTGFTHYTPSRGLPGLLSAISEKLRNENGIIADPLTDIIATPSSKQALFMCLMTILNPGDELLIPTPGWVSYQPMARLAGAHPVCVPLRAEEGFRVTRGRLEAHVTSRSKAIIVNTPNNPTGRIIDAEEADDIARFAEEHDLFIVTDEVYEKIVFDGAEHISMAAVPGCADRTLTINGFSKSYAMPGWRLGYVAGPSDLVTPMLVFAQHTVGCAGSFVQRGGVVALTGQQDTVGDMTQEYARRRDLVVAGLNALPGVACPAPGGTFYAFADIRGTGFDSSAAFTEWLLREAGVAVTPGSAFGPGGEGHVRLSFATSRGLLEQALSRMAEALRRRVT